MVSLLYPTRADACFPPQDIRLEDVTDQEIVDVDAKRDEC